MNNTESARTLEQRLEDYTTWMLLHERAVMLGAKLGVPSALHIEKCATAMVAANFSTESIDALEEAMQAFSSPFGYTSSRKHK